MKSTRKHTALLSLWATLFFLIPGNPFARPDSRSKAVAAVQKKMPACEKCSFFALPTHHPLISKHELFVASTLDRLPPQIWSVSISQDGTTLVLDWQDTKSWNQFIRKEARQFKTDAEFIDFAKLFLELAVGRALYVEKLKAYEERRLQKQTKKLSHTTTSISRRIKTTEIHFFSKDVGGQLNLWNLTIKPSGEIVDISKKGF